MALNSHGTGYEFTVNGVEYRANRLSAFDQINVARMLGPGLIRILANDDNLFTKASEASQQGGKLGMRRVVELATPILDALAALSDETVRKVIAIVMRHTLRPSTSGQGLAPMWNLPQDDFAADVKHPAPDGLTVLQIVSAFLVEEFNSSLAQRFTAFAVDKPAPAAPART